MQFSFLPWMLYVPCITPSLGESHWNVVFCLREGSKLQVINVSKEQAYERMINWTDTVEMNKRNIWEYWHKARYKLENKISKMSGNGERKGRFILIKIKCVCVQEEDSAITDSCTWLWAARTRCQADTVFYTDSSTHSMNGGIVSVILTQE
jgi:hypothetical protein